MKGGSVVLYLLVFGCDLIFSRNKKLYFSQRRKHSNNHSDKTNKTFSPPRENIYHSVIIP